MADKDIKAPDHVARTHSAKAPEQKAAPVETVAPSTNPTDVIMHQAAKNKLGDGTPLKAETTADEVQSAEVVNRSVGAKQAVVENQNPLFSSNQDKARNSENPNLADIPGTKLLVWKSGPEIQLGQFFTLGVNGHDYVFEEGRATPVENADVKDLLKLADDNDYYTITEA